MAKLYAGRLNDLHRKYPQVGFCALNASDQDSEDELPRLGLEFPYTKDEGFAAASKLGATRSPEVFVLIDGAVKYRGRIDDQYSPGTNKNGSTRNDLEIAIQELLAGKPVTVPVTEPTGCRLARPRKVTAKSVTFSQVAPILHQKCAECHRPGQVAPFSLLTYEDTVGWADTMKEVIENKRMPPWGASGGHWANDRSLTERERTILVSWLDAGAPKGDSTPSPPSFPSGWTITPDLVFTAPKFTVPKEGLLDYQDFVIDPGLTEETWVEAVEVRPGNRAVVHHATVYIQNAGSSRSDDSYFMLYVPGNPTLTLPPGLAKRIPAGWNLRLSVHYVPNGTEQQDQTSIGLKLAKHARRRVVTRNLARADFELPSFKQTKIVMEHQFDAAGPAPAHALAGQVDAGRGNTSGRQPRGIAQRAGL